MRLTNFDAGAFLRDIWQRQPLLIRGAWTDWINPLEPDELAGLACEAGIEARLVMQNTVGWKVERGPLSETRFARLSDLPWTLLVQSVDHHVPAVAALLEAFRFIPNWRVDDVMVSYAVDGGGVGAHFDQYDVFLVQGAGRRCWQIGTRCDHSTPLLPHDDLRLLAEFEVTDEWILEPGDMLYVPPGVAHKGIAVGDDCMTYSVGFRAPSRAELISHFAEHLVGNLDDDDRYGDPSLPIQNNPGEISATALTRLQEMVMERVADPAAFADWFGEFTTSPKNTDLDWRPELRFDPAALHEYAAHGTPLLRNPASRYAFIRGDRSDLTLFVDGRPYRCSGPAAVFAQSLCAEEAVAVGEDLLAYGEVRALIGDLIDQGSAAFVPHD